MKPEDKQKIRDAFARAIARQEAEADAPIEGMGKKGGGPITSRELIENSLQTEQFYNVLDQAIAAKLKTVDDFVTDFENMKLPIRMQKGPGQ
ncbi:MAG: hypothetical protein ACAH80_17940 [Alphaproteobacteria bacterium]